MHRDVHHQSLPLYQKQSHQFSGGFFMAENNPAILGATANINSYSVSGNLKYYPAKELLIGLEYMYGYREVADGTSGSFSRLQLAAKYWFGYRNQSVYEK